MTDALYVHIPFCRHICSYCDFCKVYYHKDWADEYLEKLNEELQARKADRPFRTVYIGGGTPGCLSTGQLNRLFRILEKPLSNCVEATIEMNPEDVNEKKAALCKANGITRVSLGVQTFDEKLLNLLNRHHDYAMVKKAVDILQDFDVSCDFIYGLPGQTLDDLEHDLDLFLTLGTTHVSFYNLILEKHTLLYQRNFSCADDELVLAMLQKISAVLKDHGYERYEISNYSQPGHESLHNLVYWHNERYVGIGAGASGYTGHTRYDNTRSVPHYLKGMTTYQYIDLSLSEEMFEEVMLGLRLKAGISLDEFKGKYGQDLLKVYPVLADYIKGGLLTLDDRLACTSRGFDVLDEMLVHLL